MISGLELITKLDLKIPFNVFLLRLLIERKIMPSYRSVSLLFMEWNFSKYVGTKAINYTDSIGGRVTIQVKRRNILSRHNLW